MMAITSINTSLDHLMRLGILQRCLAARPARSHFRSYVTRLESASPRPSSSINLSGASSPNVPQNRYLNSTGDVQQESPSTRQSGAQVEAFSGPSQPRQYYERPKLRDLPRANRNWPAVLGVVAVGIASWGAFLTYATNQEKISSSVFRSIIRAVRCDPNVEGVLGEAIRPQPEWWLNGDPYVRGQIGQLQGNIDVSFRIKGSKGSGTVYFTSIRKDKGEPYTTLRFKVIADDGTVVHVEA